MPFGKKGFQFFVSIKKAPTKVGAFLLSYSNLDYCEFLQESNQ